ncbi:PREDICTED: glucose dehydrogenase [FAD, quinone]-like isoform X2 [Wasmannia auropunctata]|uniref:glucose dehydrogenase [FAD, quinone]-like isoform X2 n=1 Tax=Wasmannia auropunctata TaxID=64793 RepID=UPI0005EE2A57|nr:PREDICTED: glucose dehydrogenase [FAD, quinone]-like isoform X2 [Wasmannia auropunctata]
MHIRETGYITKRHQNGRHNQVVKAEHNGQYSLRRSQSRKMNVCTSYEMLGASCASPFVGGPSLNDVCCGNSATLFLSMLTVLTTNSSIINGVCERITPIKTLRYNYDFIVVGGGAAGPIVASRLSEVKDWNVLLVEAGPDEPPGTQIPSNLQLYLNTELDWKYNTTNEKYACLRNNGSCSWPRGKNLGGCTSHHGMAYHRGHEKDYNRWTEAGNEGWSWNEVLPYFIKSEDNKEIERVGAKYHGTGGPMTVERFPWQPPIAWDIIKAAEELGLGVSEDLVGEKITGFTVAQTISRNGVRQSTPRAYLWPHRNRKNLHVALKATVIKIETKKSHSNVKATGITVVMNGRKHHIRATKEVIISAGAINSPQLLLLSGIGPKRHLESVGIRSVHDLPGVGENLHNHASYGVDFTLIEQNENLLNMNNADTYLFNQTGPLSSTGLAQVTGILASNYTTADDPDIQFFFAGYQAICNTCDRISDLKVYDNKQTVRFTAVNLRPLSRGRITLASKEPLQPPIIWSNDLAHPQDRAIIFQGIQEILKLSKANALQKYSLKMVEDETISECERYKKNGAMSYAYWDCKFRYDTRPENHQAGTCKMGPSSDPMAVVDPKTLKVHGIDGLRVADASIMPRMVSGNPVAAVNMIGERVASFIKSDYKMSDN